MSMPRDEFFFAVGLTFAALISEEVVMHKRHLVFLAAYLAASSPLAFAEWRKIPSKDFSLPPPPAVGSPAYAEDFKALKNAIAQRTEADCALGAIQDQPSLNLFFSGRESPLPLAEVMKAKSLLIPAMELSERVAGFQKDKFRRPRPYDIDPTVKPCVKKPGGSKAYPSSHAAVAATATCLLSALYPEKAQLLTAYGARLGALRVSVGVHHPSDVEAGATLGTAVCERLLLEPDFQEELEEILTAPSN
ncbi:MAG: phosphatase PAP2 family protein [Proteobacteria bacterium]|nr:MAG: phosphatase PAP2 family protein [Pseudomonadota bacterium]